MQVFHGQQAGTSSALRRHNFKTVTWTSLSTTRSLPGDFLSVPELAGSCASGAPTPFVSQAQPVTTVSESE
jgi:hypothetical protein